ncbi:hypothetical protein LIP_0532 [Limnochorda pilosa]|uniref:Uncharacterized protein n=1 Tax=Limnochorda pilosa TaxID=1555112 RepID=A0A0K2SHR8_LIMPI|nr:hypothetical protein [Limnochorda pilosa]BAS26389.1 hypothetical protein LIP_0532 [Limnochorda pilosa]
MAWELQASPPVPGVRTFVMPNPSARSTVPFEERLRLFRVLQEAALKPPDPTGISSRRKLSSHDLSPGLHRP